MIPQFEFTFAVACAVVAASAAPDPVWGGDGPVLARIWVIEGRKRVNRMWLVERLPELDGKVWGWHHIN